MGSTPMIYLVNSIEMYLIRSQHVDTGHKFYRYLHVHEETWFYKRIVQACHSIMVEQGSPRRRRCYDGEHSLTRCQAI